MPNSKRNLARSKPVSYTHLDVYKRQAFPFPYHRESIFLSSVISARFSSNTSRYWQMCIRDRYSCAIRGKENIEWVEVSEEETIDLDELEDMFPDDFCGV